VKGIQVYSNKGPGPLKRGDNHKNVKMEWGHFNPLHGRKIHVFKKVATYDTRIFYLVLVLFIFKLKPIFS
jgi:hypothetical protein